MKFWGDTETFSTVPIKRGIYRYMTGAEVMIVTWAVDNGPVQTWDRTAGPPPRSLIDAMNQCDEAWFQNAAFDRNGLKLCPELPQIPIEKWRCMMVRAYLHGLPGKLEKLSEIFKLGDLAKIDGKRYIDLFCKPQRDGTRYTRDTHPFDWECFLDYAAQDIVAMRALDVKIPQWNCTKVEWGLYTLDQERNDRGFAVDVDLATSALDAVTEESKRLGDRVEEITGGDVLKATQRDKLLAHLLGEYGVQLPDLRADTIERRLEDPELPDMVKELLRIRLRASKASTAKYRRVLECHVGGRMRGTVQFSGAQRTGRDAGRIFQPQNLARLDIDAVAGFYLMTPDEFSALPKKEKGRLTDDYMDIALDAFKCGHADYTLGDGLMHGASNLLRGVIVAEPGKKLTVADLSNIEGRKLVWLSGEEWKLQFFRDFDAGKIKFDNYIMAYARAFDVSPETVDDFMRQIGKVMELALGYQGGVGAFATMAVTYGIDLDQMAERAWASIPLDVLEIARRKYQEALENSRSALAMSEKVYMVCQALVTLWRRTHPATTKFWWAVENAAKSAVHTPDRVFSAGRLAFDRRGNWLRMRLPSGRYLCYPSPRIDDDQLSYAGVNQYTRQWCRIHTYAGKLVENADQASSRDVLKHGEALAALAGYDCVLPVHDELVCETPDSADYSCQSLSALMSTVPVWAKGLPLAAKGFETYRYKKG